MSFRVFRRAVALGLALAVVMVRLFFERLRGPLSMQQKALWSQTSSRLVLDALGIRYRVEGQTPTHGLVVSNHLSYLDILILEAAMPSFFVAKIEIEGWPIFGLASRSNGTIFLDRSSRASAQRVAGEMFARLQFPIPIVLFPEGTSTDGSHVLPFHATLIDPAIRAGASITAVSVRYVIEDGVPECELCWFGDTAFLSHLLKALGTPGFRAEVRFGEPRTYADRRGAAKETHDEVVAMRAGSVLTAQ